MLADVQRWMTGGDRPHAERWLAGTVAACGAEATALAWATLTAKHAAGEVIPSPLPLWSRTAVGLKRRGNQQPSAEQPLSRGQRKRQEIEAALTRMAEKHRETVHG